MLYVLTRTEHALYIRKEFETPRLLQISPHGQGDCMEYEFYIGVLHPVAYIIKVISSAAPRNKCLRCLFIYICYCYMFRSLLTIFRWNTQLIAGSYCF
jgi:hypothetical protein